MRKRSVGRCPKCGSTDTIRIVYGMPTEEAFDAAEKGELSLGGCCREIDAPDAKCKGCGHTWLIGATDMSERLYLYKVTSDKGGAPCDEDGILSLAICKPSIRSTAAKGDWLYGVGGVDLEHRLIFIARITNKLLNGEYYKPPYAGRRDSIYSWKGTMLKVKPDARYHTDGTQTERDVGLGLDYRMANVLVSDGIKGDAYRYLGIKGEPLDARLFPCLAKALKGLRQGHRVNHTPEVAAELVELREAVWREYPEKCSVGDTSQAIPERNGVCARGERRVVHE